MKLVIDIDDEYYATITNKVKAIRDEASKNGYAKNDVVPIGWVSIADGTPLPKGHGRIIDESEITSIYYHEEKAEQGAINFRGMVIDGTDAPTIIEADGGE